MARYMTPIRRSGPSIVELAFAGLRAEEKKVAKSKAAAGDSSQTAAAPAKKAAAKVAKLAHPKDDPWRSEPYRRLVALRPCENCARQGRSQAAHVPPVGKATKQDDRETFALCTVTPGGRGNPKPGCHELFDNYKLGDHDWAVKQGKKWAAETRAALLESGQLSPRLAAKVKAYAPPRTRK